MGFNAIRLDPHLFALATGKTHQVIHWNRDCIIRVQLQQNKQLGAKNMQSYPIKCQAKLFLRKTIHKFISIKQESPPA